MVRPPVTDLQFVADELDALATLMWGTAERMEYFGGFKGEMRQHARELAGAAIIARGWVRHIRAKPNSMFGPKSPAERAAPRESLISWANYETVGGYCQPVSFSSKGL